MFHCYTETAVEISSRYVLDTYFAINERPSVCEKTQIKKVSIV